MVERRVSLRKFDRGFESVDINVLRQAHRARLLVLGLIETVEARSSFPELPFLYERRGPDCVHTDVRREKAIKLGEETDNYKRGYHIILRSDGTICSIANTDTKKVYDHERRLIYTRGHHNYSPKYETHSRLREVRYSSQRETILLGAHYIIWAFSVRETLEGLLNNV